ncbi:hypothetical protein SAMN05892877_13231 [Rhizobium subbaraonis]|uniref:Uncharacterized protein n=1 Tax=Rhizobium subbaraonis TaxID=908946 RepID=A0A285V0Q6_9HYPH|nr:hypothetical protein [Rhizobium subbaraonis]SOC47694.1 hypothetical protein SAMN05892877_13231 [Rhizobium subbaraonis]
MSDEQKDNETLEAILRARLAHPRALVAALSINANRVLLTFGAVGDNRRVTLQVVGDEIAPPAHFAQPAEEPAADPAPETPGASVPEAAGDEGDAKDAGEKPAEDAEPPEEPEKTRRSRAKKED